MNPAAVLSIMVRAQGIRATEGELKGLDRAVAKSSDGWKKNLAGAAKTAGFAVAAAGAAAGAAGGKMIDLASDAQETASKFKTVFASETDRATKKLDEFSKATGTSKFALRDQAAQFQALIRPMGLSTKGAGAMSVGLTKMATDLASFNNTSVKDAIVALQSGLVGEAEPLRRYGVQLSAVRIEAFAYANGIAKQGEKLTSAQKAQASYGLILKDTTLAQGDAVRTSGSFANQFKRLQAQVTDLATEFGVRLIPVATAVVGAITGFIAQMKAGEGTGGTFIAAIQGIAGAFADLWGWVERNRTLLTDIGIVVGIAAVAFGAYRAVQVASAAATYVMVTAQTLLNAVLTANPIGLVIVGLVALVAGLVLAYKHSETFRNIINGAFTAIKTVAAPVVTWLATAIPAAWEWIKTATKNLWGWIGPYVKVALDIIKATVLVYFAVYKTIISAAWEAIKVAAKIAWALIKAAILDPIREVRDALKPLWEAIKGPAQKAWDALKSGAETFAKGMKTAIVGAFEGAVALVVGFVNKIIDVVNKIPGVDIKHVAGVGGGRPAQENLGGSGHLARGGAFAKTGGLINHPMTFMGEEAPRHPEFVIPTNPAYRKRAQGLLGQAAGAIGLATGGVWGKSELAELWGKVNPGNGNPNLMAAIALAESGGRQGIVNSIGATGLWQIHPGGAQFLDPAANAREAGRKLTTQGLKAWEAYTNGSYQKFMGGDSGPMSSIGSALGAIGGVMGDLLSKGADFILKKLPGTGGLPDWLKGTGKHVLDKATGFIKDKVSGLLGGGVSGAGVAGGQGFGDMLSAAQSIAARNYPYAYGGGHNASFSGPYDCSGLVSAVLHAGGLLGSPMSTDGLKVFGEAGDGKLVTIGVRGSTGRNAHTMMKLGNRYIESGSGHGASWVSGWSGGFPIHRHPVGMAKGGVFDRSKIVMPPEGWGLARGGILGSYKDGTPYVPQTGAYLLHQGESVIPAEAFAAGGAYAKGTGVKLPSNSAKSQIQRAAKIKAAQAFVKAQKAQIAKGLRPGAAAAVVVVSGDVGGGGGDPNQALIDAINAKAEQDKQLADEQKARDDAQTVAVLALQGEVKRQTDFAANVQSTSNFQLTKSLADLLSGHIVGRGVAGRAFTPGTGVEVVY